MKISAEIVKGICPTCEEDTTLVGLTPEVYRCMNCGADLQQHIYLLLLHLQIKKKCHMLRSGNNAF